MAIVKISESKHNILILSLFLLMAAVFFYPALSGHETLLLRDLNSQTYGPKVFYQESMRSGNLPLWNPYILSGTPYLANPHNSALYPFTWIFVILPVDYAIGVFIALHMALFAFFVYLLTRECGVSRAGALLSGCAAFIAGMPLKEVEYPELACGMAWMPLIIYYTIRVLRGRRWGPVIGLGVASAMQTLSGIPYPIFYSIVCIVLVLAWFMALYWDGFRNALRGVGYLCVAGILAFLLSAPQMLPVIELTLRQPAETLNSVMPAGYSMRLVDGLLLFFPTLFGYPDWQKCIYVGLVPLILAFYLFLSILFRNKGTSDSDTQVSKADRNSLILIIALFLLGVVLSAGGYLGVDKLVSHIPVLNRAYKWPSLSFSIATIAIATFAGLAFDRLSEKQHSHNHKLTRICFLSCAIIVMAVLCFSLPWLEEIRSQWRQIEMVGTLRSATLALSEFPLSRALILFGTFSFLALIPLAALFFFRTNKWVVFALLIAVMLVDKGYFLSGLRFFNKTNVYTETSPNADLLVRAGAASSNVRIYVPPILGAFNAQAYGSSNTEDFMLVKNLLIEGTAIPKKLFITEGCGSLREPDYEFVIRPWIESLQGLDKNRMLGLMNVKYMIDAGIRDERFYYNGFVENHYYLPRVRFASSVLAASSWDECFQILNDARHPLLTTTVLHNPPVGTKFLELGTNVGRAESSLPEYSAGKITIKTKSDTDSYLVIADSYDPNWRGYIDNQETQVFKADLYFKAVYLPAGEHVVEFVYSAHLFWKGVVLFCIGLLFIALICFGPSVKRRLSKVHAST